MERTTNVKAHNQSPLKVKFEREPNDSEEEQFPARKHKEESYAQASPYSPAKRKSHSNYYQEIDHMARIHTDGDYLNSKEHKRSSSYSKFTNNNRFPDQKYEILQTEPTWLDNDDTKGNMLSRNMTSSSSTQKYSQKSFEEPVVKEWKTPNTIKTRPIVCESQKSLLPPKDVPEFIRKDSKETKSNPSICPKPEKAKDAFASQEAAILQSKQKIREDIEK